jgi:hypothetical protein
MSKNRAETGEPREVASGESLGSHEAPAEQVLLDRLIHPRAS